MNPRPASWEHPAGSGLSEWKKNNEYAAQEKQKRELFQSDDPVEVTQIADRLANRLISQAEDPERLGVSLNDAALFAQYILEKRKISRDLEERLAGIANDVAVVLERVASNNPPRYHAAQQALLMINDAVQGKSLAPDLER